MTANIWLYSVGEQIVYMMHKQLSCDQSVLWAHCLLSMHNRFMKEEEAFLISCNYNKLLPYILLLHVCASFFTFSSQTKSALLTGAVELVFQAWLRESCVLQ